MNKQTLLKEIIEFTKKDEDYGIPKNHPDNDFNKKQEKIFSEELQLINELLEEKKIFVTFEDRRMLGVKAYIEEE